MFNKYIKIFILCFLIVTGCVQNKATGDRQLVILSQDEENNIGAREHPKIIKAFGGIYEDKNLQEYINNIGIDLHLIQNFLILDGRLQF